MQSLLFAESYLLGSDDMVHEHTKVKPEVALFCLIGMKDSFTDFHIDFGGSSVWYHVFKGQKIFYVVEPTDENLASFVAYQNDSKRTEIFFGDCLPPGSVSKIVINAGETLMIPSGWIHAVFTPCDSLVFGGNFLHSLNIDMQLRIYDMELYLETEERFMFPSFELTNWYAAANFLDLLKEANDDNKTVEPYLLKGIKSIMAKLKEWSRGDQKRKMAGKHPWFGKLQQQLSKEVNMYKKRKRTGSSNGASMLRREKLAVSLSGTSVADNSIASSTNFEKKQGIHSCEQMRSDSFADTAESCDETVESGGCSRLEQTLCCAECSSAAFFSSVANGDVSVAVNVAERYGSVDAQRDRKEMGSAEEGNYNSRTLVNSKDSKNIDEEVVSSEGISLAAMFSHRSRHGRIPKPKVWVTESDEFVSPRVIETSTAKKIPPHIPPAEDDWIPEKRERIHSSKRKSGPEAAIKRGSGSRRKATTARQRLACKLKIKI